MCVKKLIVLSLINVCMACGTNQSTTLESFEPNADSIQQGGTEPLAETSQMPMPEETSGDSISEGAEEDEGVRLNNDPLERAFRFLIGKFNSATQAAANPSYFNVQLHACAVDAPELGERVLYIEQAMNSALNQPYRQRLYVVKDNGDGRVASVVYTINQPERYIGLCDRGTTAVFTPDEVAERIGCTVYLRLSGQFFAGGTEGQACASALRGASYATSQVALYADKILSWDQGFDAQDTQVWGAVDGPYEFLRIDANPDRDDMVVPTETVPSEDVNELDSDSPSDDRNVEGLRNLGGETCTEAPYLADVSEPIPAEDAGEVYRYRVESAFGQRNDYNPMQGNDDDMGPACSIVYDAIGRDSVFSVYLEPGQTLALRLTMTPGARPGGLYMLDQCESPSWPDLDGSGACGSNEYVSHGACFRGNCDSLEWSYAWPEVLNGRPMDGQELFLVVDEIASAAAERFVLDWAIY